MLGRKTREDRAHRQRTLAEQRRDRDVLGQRAAIGMVAGDDSQLAPDGNRTLLNACTPSGDSVHIRRGQIGSAASTAATVAKRLGGLPSVTPTRRPPTLLGSTKGSAPSRSEEHTYTFQSLMRT